ECRASSYVVRLPRVTSSLELYIGSVNRRQQAASFAPWRPPGLCPCTIGYVVAGTTRRRSLVVFARVGRLTLTSLLEHERARSHPSDDSVVASTTGSLLERAGELARIETALTAARTGRGTFVVMEGPAGIGKTALLAAARAEAAENGMHVLRARAAELERDFAFGVVRQLFEPALAEASELDRVDLLGGAAGVAAELLGLPGARATNGAPSSGVDPSFA